MTLRQRLKKWKWRLARARRRVARLRRRIARRRELLTGKGPDVSNWQGRVDWEAVKQRGGASFGVCKATEGQTYTDPSFARNWAAMKAARLPRVAYHFARPGRNLAADEARHFAKIVKRHGYDGANDLLALDVETENSETLDEWCDEFFAELRRLMPLRAEIVYTYSYFRQWKPRPNRKLWIAAYGSSYTLPKGWESSQVIAWQYTDRETWPGVAGPCDSNRAI